MAKMTNSLQVIQWSESKHYIYEKCQKIILSGEKRSENLFVYILVTLW